MINLKFEFYKVTSSLDKQIRESVKKYFYLIQLLESNLRLKQKNFEINHEKTKINSHFDLIPFKKRNYLLSEDKIFNLNSFNSTSKGNFYYPLNRNYKVI